MAAPDSVCTSCVCVCAHSLVRNWPLSTWFRWRSATQLGRARAILAICIGKEYKINETLFFAAAAALHLLRLFIVHFLLACSSAGTCVQNCIAQFPKPRDHTLDIWWHSAAGVIPVFLYPGAHLHIMNNHFCSHFCGVMKDGGVSNGRPCRRWLGCWLVNISWFWGRVLAGLEKLLMLLTRCRAVLRCNRFSSKRVCFFNFESWAQIWASRYSVLWAYEWALSARF